MLFLRIGRDDEDVADAVFEAEDPEGLVNEGMPPSLDHIDPTSLNATGLITWLICYILFYKYACCFTNSLACRLTHHT